MRISDWSSDVCSSDLVDDRQQDQRADKRHEQRANIEGARDNGSAADERSHDPPRQHRSHDADDDIQENALLAVGAHDDAGQPADDAADDQKNDEAHERSEEHTSELQSLMRISYAV